MGVARRYGSTKCHYIVHVKMNGEKVNFTLCEFHFVKKEEEGERENVGVKQQGRDWTLLLGCEVEEGAASRGMGAPLAPPKRNAALPAPRLQPRETCVGTVTTGL